MPKRSWHIIIGPQHIVQLTADTMEQVGEVLTFRNWMPGPLKDSSTLMTVAQFSHYMGWLELLEQPKEPASVTSLTLVPRGDPPPDTPPPGDAAA